MMCFSRSFLSVCLLLLVICLVAISPASAYAGHLLRGSGCSGATGSGCSGGTAVSRTKIFTKKIVTRKSRGTSHSISVSAPAPAAPTAKTASEACVGGVCQMLSAVIGLPGATGITHIGDYRPARFGN